MMMKDWLPHRIAKRGASTAMTILLVGLFVSAAVLVVSAGASAPLNSVQVTVQTTANLPFQYTLTAYNSSGYQVAAFGGNYPEAAFGLPSGVYLITASAYYQQSYCNLCPVGLKSTSGTTSTPIRYVNPVSEYGYAVVKLTGPTQLTITTSNSTSASLVSIPVHVQFVNGTAAVGAYVSGYVVGDNYAYSSQWVTYGQTGSDGSFTLVLPNAPVQVSASLSVPIQLPQNVSVIPIEIGGQKTNVTVTWQPNYISLYGQALILPPQSSASITLTIQQSIPYPIYANSGQGSVAVTTIMSTTTAGVQQGSAPAQSGRIAPFSPSASQLSSPSQAASGGSFGTAGYLIVGIGAVALVFAAGAVTLSRRKRVESARP